MKVLKRSWARQAQTLLHLLHFSEYHDVIKEKYYRENERQYMMARIGRRQAALQFKLKKLMAERKRRRATHAGSWYPSDGAI
jgi:hypothetical protein